MKKRILVAVGICLLFSSGVFASNIVREYYAKESNSIIEINGEMQDFELPVVSINDSTYVALRQLSEKFGYKVYWIEEESKIALSNVKSSEKEELITEKETAIKIGSALLAEHFPEYFPKIEMNITAEERDDIWKVYNVNPEIITDDGRIQMTKGGVIYVELRKSNGEIIKIGIDD